MKGFFLFVVCQSLLASLVISEVLDVEKLLKSLDTEKSSDGHREEDSIPKPLLDEFTTYIDRLMVAHDTTNLGRSDLTQEIKNDFNKLRMILENDPSESEDPAELKPGQVPALACSHTRYGCCPDGSARPTKGKAGCAIRLCEDVYKDKCNDLLVKGDLNCDKMWTTCPYSCNRCKSPAAPITECERKNPGALCCWDGKIGTGANRNQCRPCFNHYRRACGIFKYVSRGCRSNSWRIRTFMQTHCPVTCGLC